jgi:predicted permease
MISLLLMQKIAELFLVMAMGFALVKTGLLKQEQSQVLSRICLYLLVPCVLITAFEVDYRPELRAGLLLAFAAAVVIHLILLAFDFLLRKATKFDGVERASVMYSNAGNLIIPIVTSVLGQEWVIYSSAFVSVQMVFLWTHGVGMFSGEHRPQIRKILLNPSMIAIFLGLLLLITGLRLPGVISSAFHSVGNMVGPTAMLITGMLVAGMPPRKLFGNRRIFLVTALRMLVCPAVMLALVKLSHAASLVPNGNQVLLITLLATMTPVATTITQFAQLYGRDAEYASAINILSTLVCIGTMPMFVALYSL